MRSGWDSPTSRKEVRDDNWPLQRVQSGDMRIHKFVVLRCLTPGSQGAFLEARHPSIRSEGLRVISLDPPGPFFAISV